MIIIGTALMVAPAITSPYSTVFLIDGAMLNPHLASWNIASEYRPAFGPCADTLFTSVDNALLAGTRAVFRVNR